jgi:hypothetical protein
MICGADAVEEAIDCVAEGLAATKLGVEVLEGNSDRSCCWNSTIIGWPHMMTGPVTLVLAKIVLFVRARTTVAALELE